MVAAATAPKTVLIASHAESVRDRFSAALDGAGHTAIGAGSTGELLACLRARRAAIDLVILDLRLGPPLGRLPVLIFSGSISHAEQVRDLSALDVAGYVNEHSRAERVVPALAPHLFPDSFDRRTSRRVRLGVPITCRFDGALAAAFMLNLAKGGIGVRTVSPLANGTRVQVRFRLPGSERDIEAAARVAWSDQRLGMGLEFEQIDAADQAAIDAFVDRHAVADAAGAAGRASGD